MQILPEEKSMTEGCTSCETNKDFPEFHRELSTGYIFAIGNERIETKDGKTFIVANIVGNVEAGMRYLQSKAEMYEKHFKENINHD